MKTDIYCDQWERLILVKSTVLLN